MWKIIFKGGIMIYPILLCSILSIAIILERIYFFNKIYRNIKGFVDRVIHLIKKGKIKDALRECESSGTPLGEIMKAGLSNYDRSKEKIKESMEEASLYQMPKLEKNLSFLATIAHISPLLGLLGTVLGLVKCFHTIEVKVAHFGSIAPSDLAGGIWEALLTTVAGLIVAIPAYVAYNYFVHKLNLYVLEMEKITTELLEILGGEAIKV